MTRTFVTANDVTPAWWKHAIVYQIYPASFCDSNGDGIGDINGITSKVDYLKDLGVDVVWLSPIFKSPQADMGYDISDYEDIHEPYGTIKDVETLIDELHKRGMKLLLDLVVNHTSDEHPWFIESRSSKLSPKRDWYIWRPAKYDADGTRIPPNNWKASFGGSVWEWDEISQEYYLHYYDKKQPDLNFEIPAVRHTIYEMMKFWLDKGCDGYRMDVIGRISKDHSFPDSTVTDPDSKWQEPPRLEGPRIHEFLQEMNHEVLSKYDILTVGELNHTNPQQMLNYVHPNRKELHMGFSFEHVNIGLAKRGRLIVEPWKLSELKSIFTRWQLLRDKGAWHALYLENHDQPRSISRYGNDSPQWREASGKMLAMMHLTLCGTVYLYQGQEIGMINLPNNWPLKEWKDVLTQNVVRSIRERGIDVQEKTRTVLFKARDNSRSPMQWNSEPYGGFSSVKPWMRVPNDYKLCNVASQMDDNESMLSFWKEMLKLRKDLAEVLVYSNFQPLSPEDDNVFAYIRGNSILVVLNFTSNEVKYQVPVTVIGATLLKATIHVNRHPKELKTNEIVLGPYDGVMYDLV